MKAKFFAVLILFVACLTDAYAQWLPNPYTSGNIYFNGGNVGIGTNAPTGLLDIRGGLLQVINYSPNAYTYLGRSTNPGNDSYFFHRITNNFHLIGSNKNGSEVLRKIGLAIGGGDVETDVKMTVDPSGLIGIGTINPSSQLHVASDDTHALTISRANGFYGFRILRNAQEGNFYFQIGSGPSTWETKIKIGEGEGANTKLLLNPDGGNVGIGSTNPDSKLTVKGTVHAEEVKVDLSVPGPDYVFEDSYPLQSLEEIEYYVKRNKHLPDVPSAMQMEEEGIKVGEMNILLLKKVEELTLHLIKQNQLIMNQQSEIEELKSRLK